MLLTIFTPTYNRANTLPRLYNSLIMQKNNDKFEWLIVDGVSTDNTRTLIEEYINEGKLSIRYYEKNGGKPFAYNIAIENAESEYFFCVDSDDWLVDNSISKIIERIDEIRNNEATGGFAGMCINERDELLEKPYKKEFITNTIIIKDKKGKDKPEIIKTKYLKEYRFPIFENEKILAEAYLFDKLTLKYPLLFTNDILMGKEYLPSGITADGVRGRINSIKGTLSYYRQRIDLAQTFKGKIKSVINFNRFRFWNKQEKPLKKLYFLRFGTYLISYFMYLRDKKQFKNGNGIKK